MVAVIIDEEKIEQISEVFLKERQQQQLRVDEWTASSRTRPGGGPRMAMRIT